MVILAAGKSERMKEMKAFLRFDETHSFIDRIVENYSSWGCREIVIVTSPDACRRINTEKNIPEWVSLIVNDHLDFERFYSVKLGIGAINTSPFCFIQNIDNPFIDEEILDYLYQYRSPEQYISPVFMEKGGHPVLLNRKNMKQILSWPENSATFKEVLSTMDSRRIEMQDERVLVNINNPGDYDRYFHKNQ